MKNSLLVLFCFGLFNSRGVVGEDELVKKGTFPYMAFIYYDDPSVVNILEERIVRSAVLIREDWLVTSAIDVTSDGFPKKTLLARVGAVRLDGNFTFNEEEDEQEREVIQIVRPYNHSATQWWTTDISLVKTLFPFNVTQVVNYKVINKERHFTEKTCIILFYAQMEKLSDDKELTQMFVELLDPTIENCGAHFTADGMTCANDKGDDNKTTFYDSDFCHGSSGGPLICEGEVVGLQTYIENKCEEPHLYQLLSAWDNFITCGVEEKCAEEQCSHICDVINKDPAESDTIIPTTTTYESTTSSVTTATPETVTPYGEIVTTSTFATVIVKVSPMTVERTSATVSHASSKPRRTTEVHWPSVVEIKEQDDQSTEVSDEPRRFYAEAESQVIRKKNLRVRNDAEKTMCIVQTVVFGLVLCLF